MHVVTISCVCNSLLVDYNSFRTDSNSNNINTQLSSPLTSIVSYHTELKCYFSSTTRGLCTVVCDRVPYAAVS